MIRLMTAWPPSRAHARSMRRLCRCGSTGCVHARCLSGLWLAMCRLDRALQHEWHAIGACSSSPQSCGGHTRDCCY